MITDGLWDAFNDFHMGITAENLAQKYDIDRAQQDAFAAQSQQRAAAAIESGRFDAEITPVMIPQRKGTRSPSPVTSSPRRHHGRIPRRPARSLQEGRLRHRRQRLDPQRRRRRSGADERQQGRGPGPAGAGQDRRLRQRRRRPGDHGHRPGHRHPPLPGKAGWTLAELDLIEANEAFAVQALSVGKELGWDADKVNVNGGAIALGHPIGASGCRILVTLLHEMQRRDVRKSLATLCIGGGQE